MPENKKNNKVTSTKTTIINNIKKIMKELDENSLIFLLEQAQILKHNMEVDRINKEILESKEYNKNKSDDVKKVKESINIIADSDGKNFILDINGNRKFFTHQEFRKIVEISYKGTSVDLYNWLYKERRDFLIDLGIRLNNSQFLNNLINLIKGKYKLKQ